jgi:hypothetical protein
VRGAWCFYLLQVVTRAFRTFVIIEGERMSAKTATKQRNLSDNWKGYVNWNPLASDRELVVEYMGSKGWDAHLVIEQLVQEGYTVSHSWDDKSSCVRLSVTGKTQPCPNIGYTLSVRASSVERCVGLVGYYCFILCQGQDWLVEKVGGEVW